MADLRLRLPHRHQQHVAPASPAVVCEGKTLALASVARVLRTLFTPAPCKLMVSLCVLTLGKPCAAQSSRHLCYAGTTRLAYGVININHTQ